MSRNYSVLCGLRKAAAKTVFCLFLAVLCVSSNARAFVQGDVAPRGNPDGVVDIADALVMIRFASGLTTPTANEILRGDTVPPGALDNLITLGDALMVLRAVLGYLVLNDGDIDEDGFRPSQGDCNDNDPSIYPDAQETCDDGIDQDCDDLDLVCAPPVITILEPQDQSRISTQTPYIEISYSDSGTAIDLSMLKITLNGGDLTSDFTISPKGASYQTVSTDPIFEGVNTIQVDLADLSGAGGTETSAFTLDSEGLGFAVLNLPDETSTVDTSFLLTGTITPDVTTITIGGVAATISNGYFISAPIALAPGTNTIEIVFTDGNGNSHTETVIIDQAANPDGISVSITSPTGGAIVNSSSVDVSGTFTGSASSIMVNNVQAAVSGSTFTAKQVSLTIGTNPIIVSAYDSAGNVTNHTILVSTNDKSDTLTLTSNPATGLAPLSVTLTANTAITGITNYDWDLDGDGTVDISTSTNTTATTYNEVRRYFPTVIINSGGVRYSDTLPVETTLPVVLTASAAISAPVDLVRDLSTGDVYILTDTSIEKFDSGLSSGQTVTSLQDPPGGFVLDFLTGEIFYTVPYNAGMDRREIKVFDPNGLAIHSSLNYPGGVAVDAAGNIYIADSENHRIRKVDTSGIISNVAGDGNPAFQGDGDLAINASLNFPINVAVDAAGNIYVADSDNYRIRKIDTNGIIDTIAGGGPAFVDGGQATDSSLDYPWDVTVDASGNFIITDDGDHRVRMVDTNGIITTVAGNGTAGAAGDGDLAVNANLYHPDGVAVDALGNIFIADWGNHRIRKVDTNGIITTLAGNGTQGDLGDGGLAIYANLNYPLGVEVDGSGNIYIADAYNNRIRKVDANGIITTVAGNGTQGDSGDGGLAVNANLNAPSTVAADGSGNIYIADWDNHRIRKVDTHGIITTVAGNGTPGYQTPQNTTIYTMDVASPSPSGAAINENGEVLITAGSEILWLNASGALLKTIAGDPGSDFKGIFLDILGDIYIADSGNNKIIKFSSGGTKEFEFGTAGSGNGELLNPSDVSVDEINDQILVADTGNNRIQILDRAGNFVRNIINDGAGTSLNTPNAVASDNSDLGTFTLISDRGNNRIIQLELPAADPAAVWNAMKGELINGDIQGALGYFSEGSKNKYESVFNALGPNLSTLATAMNPIRKSFIKGTVAEYKIDRDVVVNAENHTLTFPIYFVKDENGVWKIDSF